MKFQRTPSIRTYFLLVILSAGLAACSPSAPAATPAPTAPPPTAVPSATPVPAGEAATPAPTASSSGTITARLVPAPSGNEARFRVREQLAGVDFPSDAVGSTSAIEGSFVVTSDGNTLAIVSEESRFVVDVTTLQSDSGMRDNFIRRNTLETNTFPTAEFVLTQAVGLPAPLPTSGEVIFQLVGDLTVHGVTRSATWDVTAQVLNDHELQGTAITSFTFADHGMTIPRVARVLSIEDHIQLEYDFHFIVE